MSPTSLLVYVAIIAGLVAARSQYGLQQLRREYRQLRAARASETSGMYSPVAIPIRLDPELEWTRHLGKQMGLIVFHVYGSRAEAGAASMRSVMRAHETAYRIAPRRYLVALWDISEPGLVLAVSRLGERFLEAGCGTMDAGAVLFPDEGDTVTDLVDRAVSRFRPVQDYLDQIGHARVLHEAESQKPAAG